MMSQDERWDLMAMSLAAHRQVMLEVARSHVTCPMAAEDIVQDATIVALRCCGSLKHGAAVRPWLLRITVTVARKSVAKRARRRALRASHFAAPADPPAPSSEPDRRTDTIVDALESLPELQQRTVRCLLDGLSYRETATKLDKTPGAVRMLRQRAVDNLRRMLRPPPPASATPALTCWSPTASLTIPGDDMTSAMQQRTGIATLAILLATTLPPTTASAQEECPDLPFPEGWEVRFDREGMSMDDLCLVTMPPGLHITTGPRLIAYHPDSVASGDFRIESQTYLFDPEGRREAFGFFIGGSDLQGPGQRYTYFLLREGGEFLVKTRSGTATPVVQDWTAHPAIVSYATKPADANTAGNVLALEADGDELRFYVNGEQVWSGPRGELATDGIFGLRVNHRLNLHVTTIMSGGLPD